MKLSRKQVHGLANEMLIKWLFSVYRNVKGKGMQTLLTVKGLLHGFYFLIKARDYITDVN